MQQALGYASEYDDTFVRELEAFLRIPSISTDEAYAHEVRRAADWLAQEFTRIGADNVALHETGGHPIVMAEFQAGDELPTVLIYGHYDVQPPDPLELWTTPPFEPTIRDNKLYARGSCDDKGQLFMHVKAVDAYLASGLPLPVNVVFIVEGEEESGSLHLRPFLEEHASDLAGDIVLISDTSMLGEGIPSVTYGLRGTAYVEVLLTGPNRDLHSGVYGGAVENPINVLARLIADLHDERHRMAIPGFYDDVRDLTDDERSAIRDLPFDPDAWLRAVGVGAVRTEDGYTVLEATWARPALDVNGIWGGYQGQGAKTVLPAKAGAKISVRLVPDQQPDDVVALLKRYFEEHTPETMELTFRNLHGGHAVVVDRDIPAMRAASDALEGVFGRKPAFIREGGTIPVVADFKQVLGLDTVLMGFGLNSDAIHSPNEHFGLDRFHQGIASSIRFLEAFGKCV
jgi:acetylornithine deacetylase/succinyl-diaminopimelate desuccinylase-like protein